ncbi:protoporphyrinogen oxidase, partial [Francisella tularensis subsp. holarctica]|nr:protoporphyrinogen oxidase [Francisella tularensis subsp. holarctica]
NLISVGIVTNKSSLKHIKNLAGLIGKEQYFYSTVSRDVIDNPNYRALVFHCRDEFSQEELLVKSIEVLKIKPDHIIDTYT